MFVKVQLKAATVVNNTLRFKAEIRNYEDWAAYGDSTPIIGIVYCTTLQRAVWFDLGLFARRVIKLGNMHQDSKSVTLRLADGISVNDEFTMKTLTEQVLPYVCQLRHCPSLGAQLNLSGTWLSISDALDDDIALDNVKIAIDEWIQELGKDLSVDFLDEMAAFNASARRQFLLLPRAILRHYDLFSAAQTTALRTRLDGFHINWLELLVYANRFFADKNGIHYLLGLSPQTSHKVAKRIRNGKFGNPEKYSSPVLQCYLDDADMYKLDRQWRNHACDFEWRGGLSWDEFSYMYNDYAPEKQ